MQVNPAAGFWIRLGAVLLDAIIIAVPLTIISFIVSGGTGEENFTNLLSFLYSLLVPVFWNGFTVGKRICGIRIRRVRDQGPPGILNMLLRIVVAGIVYALTLGIGIIASVVMVVVREDKRTLHDLIAGTEVVYD